MTSVLFAGHHSPFNIGPTLTGKSLLLLEKILSFKSGAPLRSQKTKMRVTSPESITIYFYHIVAVFFNPIALRKAKIAYNFGLSECSRVKM